MNTTTETPNRPRIPLLAALLSLFLPGLGQMYCGKISRGLVLWFASSLVAAVGMVLCLMALAAWPGWVGYAAVAAMAAGMAICVYAILDAHGIARKTGHYVLKDYNRWYVYLLLVLIQLPLTVPVTIGLRAGVIEAFRMVGDAMAPTLRKGDRVLVNKLAYRTQAVRRGDIVACVNPNKRHQTNIRRVAALPGDTVEMRDGVLLVNGQQVTLNALAGQQTQAGEFPLTKLANGYCFVLNDNRGHAEDSRSFGPVPLGDIIGRAEVVYWPRWVKLRPENK